MFLLQGGLGGDCCVSFCCGCCGVVQMLNVSSTYGSYVANCRAILALLSLSIHQQYVDTEIPS